MPGHDQIIRPETEQNGSSTGQLAVVFRDATDWLPYVKSLHETDVIILLTPIVVPISQDPTDISDPFEPLGRSLAKRHARVRQVPYTKRYLTTANQIRVDMLISIQEWYYFHAFRLHKKRSGHHSLFRTPSR